MAVCKEASERLGSIGFLYSIWNSNVYINLGGKMITREDYAFNAKHVEVEFTERWLGWYDVVNEIGKKKTVKKFKDRFYECSGHGHPIFDITDCVKEATK